MPRFCLDCATSLDGAHHRRKRCPVCAKKDVSRRNVAWAREHRKGRPSTRGRVVPRGEPGTTGGHKFGAGRPRKSELYDRDFATAPAWSAVDDTYARVPCEDISDLLEQLERGLLLYASGPPWPSRESQLVGGEQPEPDEQSAGSVERHHSASLFG